MKKVKLFVNKENSSYSSNGNLKWSFFHSNLILVLWFFLPIIITIAGLTIHIKRAIVIQSILTFIFVIVLCLIFRKLNISWSNVGF